MKYLSLLVFLVLTGAAAWFGAQFEPGTWHAALAKPAWNPPNAVFGPVWTVLYVLIAIAGWRVWLDRALPYSRTALALWGVQLVLNAAWSWIFFGLHRTGWALVDIGLLLAAIGAFIAVTWRPRRSAALLFVPYFAWVAFAIALNAAIWWLNRGT
jgi:benzodiazapine receptor